MDADKMIGQPRQSPNLSKNGLSKSRICFEFRLGNPPNLVSPLSDNQTAPASCQTAQQGCPRRRTEVVVQMPTYAALPKIPN